MGGLRGFTAASAAVVLVMGIAACGGSGDDDSSTSAGASSAAAQPGLARAKAATAENSKVPSSIGTQTPLEKSATGKRVAYIQCLTDICVTGGKNFVAAGNELGFKTTIVGVGPTPDAATKAMNSIVAGHFDAVVIGLVPAVLVARQVAQLHKEGIPIIAAAHQAKPNPAVVGEFLGEKTIYKVGSSSANLVTSDSGGKGKVVYLWTPEFPGLVNSLNGFKETLKSNCPGCKMDVLNVKTSDIGTGIPKQVVSYLQKHPDVDYVVCQFGDIFTGLPQGLKTAGLSGQVKLIDDAGSPVNFEYIKKGEEFATVGSFIDVLAWQTADQVAKVMAGQKFEEPVYPTQLMFKKDITFDTNGQPTFGDPSWQDKFKQLWAQASS